MAKLKAHGPEIARYFSATRGALISICADGVTLYRTPLQNWKVLARKKPEANLASWTANKLALVAGLKPWQQAVKTLPSIRTLDAWANDGVCESVTGDTVEPDGRGPDGAPSWLLALHYV